MERTYPHLDRKASKNLSEIEDYRKLGRVSKDYTMTKDEKKIRISRRGKWRNLIYHVDFMPLD